MSNEIPNYKGIDNLVSIIMPAYNCEKFISETIISVQNQIYKNWELIIVDDCSTDSTEKIVKGFAINDSRINYYKLLSNSGAAFARNYGIKKVNGEFIAFLDSDDLWFPEKLNIQITRMRDLNITFSCTAYNKIDEAGNDLNVTLKPASKISYQELLKNCPGNSTVAYNANKLGRYLIPDIKKRNDYVMWLKIIKQSEFLIGFNETLSSHRLREDSLSSSKVKLVKYHWKIYREIEKLDLFKSVYLILYWVKKGLNQKLSKANT